MTKVEPGAMVVTCRKVDATASLVRYVLTPMEETTAGLSGSKPEIWSQIRHCKNQFNPRIDFSIAEQSSVLSQIVQLQVNFFL